MNGKYEDCAIKPTPACIQSHTHLHINTCAHKNLCWLSLHLIFFAEIDILKPFQAMYTTLKLFFVTLCFNMFTIRLLRFLVNN